MHFCYRTLDEARPRDTLALIGEGWLVAGFERATSKRHCNRSLMVDRRVSATVCEPRTEGPGSDGRWCRELACVLRHFRPAKWSGVRVSRSSCPHPTRTPTPAHHS